MKRTLAALAALTVSALLLAGCSTNAIVASPTATATTAAIDLTSTDTVNSLCGDAAKKVLGKVVTAQEALPNSGSRNALTRYDIKNPQDDAALTELVGALKVRANTDCANTTTVNSTEDGTVGIENTDGTVASLPLVTGTDATNIVIDTTTQPATPPLLDGSLRFTAQTLSWAGLVERVGDQQWYKDGINAHAAQTGFTWDDVLKFASANKIVDGKIQGVNALAIQVYNYPTFPAGSPEAAQQEKEVRDQVRGYITPVEEEIIGLTVDELPIQRINNGFVNTRRAGTADAPQMGDYFDTEKMIRVSLMPLSFDATGAPVSLDGTRGAGIFIDCGNLHWVPTAVWKCTSASCEKPVCPMGTTGTPPNCVTPPPPPTTNPKCPPGTNGTPPNCLQPKNWSKSVSNGWTPLGAGPLTDGKISQRQQASGEVSGNVTDNPVPAGTKSDVVTPDLPKGTVTAPGATPGGDTTSNDAVDPTVTNQDAGGTHGDTCIADPDTGVSTCG